MTELIQRPLDGMLLSSRDMVRVVARLHPMRGGRIDRLMLEGLSIEECLKEVFGPLGERALVVYLLDDKTEIAIPRKLWGRVRPKAGTTVIARPALHNGNAIKTVLTLALIVASFFVAGPIGSAIGLAGLIGASAATGLVSGLIMIGGTLALNALFPTRPAQLGNGNEAFTQLPSVQGARNEARKFEPIPLVLGRHRMSPVYAAQPYTELVGDDQWLRLLFCFGYGPLSYEDFRIGETPLSSLQGWEMEVRQGYAADAPISLYPSQVSEEALAVTLVNIQSWQTRTSAAGVDEISVDFTAPEGIYKIDEEGNPGNWSVTIAAQYRAAGSGDSWASIGAGSVQFTRATKTKRLGLRQVVPNGQYDVRVMRMSADESDVKIKDKVIWSALRSFTNANPIAYDKPLALIALRIKATDQLNGVVDTFNAVVSSGVTAFNGSVWQAGTFSNNPANLYRWVLQAPANARPVDDAQIDIVNLQEWWAYCNTEGFTFNHVRSDRSSVYDALADIAAAGRAVPTFNDGKWGVIWDQPDATVVQHFTPRNSWAFSLSKPIAHRPHAWRVRFINASNGWTQDERIVYADGYDATSATLFEGLEFPGVTDPDLIWRHGRFHMAQIQLRPEEVTLTAGWENLICTRGDRVRVTNDVALIGLAAGRLKSVDGQVVTLDETVLIEAGKTYGIRFRTPALISALQYFVVDVDGTGTGETKELTLVGDLSGLTAGNLFGFGESEQDSAVYRVKSIAHQKDLIAQLVLVDDAPEIADADSGDIPAYTPNVTIPADPFTQPPQNFKYIEVIAGAGATARALVRLSWTVPRRGKVAAFEIQVRDDNSESGSWEQAGTVNYPVTTLDVPLINAGLWSYRVRSLFTDGTVSDWVTLTSLNLLGLLDPPDDVSNFIDKFIGGRVFLTWDPVQDNRTLFYEIRKGESWDAALIVAEALAQPQFQTLGDDTYWISCYVVTPFGVRVYSLNKQSLTLSNTVLTANVVVSRDEKATGWDGYFGGTVGRDDELGYLRTSGADNFLAVTSVLAEDDILNKGAQGGGFYRSKIIVDAGRQMPCRISVDYTATGVPAVADFLGQPDFLANPDFLQSYLTQFIRVYPVIRIGTAADPDVFAPGDVFAEDDVYAAGITWGEWQKWSPDVYRGRFFQVGLVFEILDTSVNAIAYALSFAWVIDVEDRLDRYIDLTVPVGGLAISFVPTGSATAAPFKGGINNEPLPHILTGQVDRPTGHVVNVTDLTLAGCKLTVVDADGVDVGGSRVNLMAQGYG